MFGTDCTNGESSARRVFCAASLLRGESSARRVFCAYALLYSY